MPGGHKASYQMPPRMQLCQQEPLCTVHPTTQPVRKTPFVSQDRLGTDSHSIQKPIILPRQARDRQPLYTKTIILPRQARDRQMET